MMRRKELLPALLALMLLAPVAVRAQITTQASFGTGTASGTNPRAGLTDVNGTLYGTTEFGGSANGGTLFSYTPGGSITTLASFGTGTASGMEPLAELTDVNGTLYGTTASGGSANGGTLFSYTPGGSITTLASFGTGTASGMEPLAELTDVNGTLYGTTSQGGAPSSNGGTLFSYTPGGGIITLGSFGTGSVSGADPWGALANVSGTFYGTTYLGGSTYRGTLFSYTPGSSITTLASFGTGTASGTNPLAGLTDVNGTLYGTTQAGGSVNGGALFSYTPGGGITTLASFGTGTASGTRPEAGLLTDVNGTLYGTTPDTLFSYLPGAGITTLASLPIGLNEVTDVNGTLYGTSSNGGPAGYGTVFSYALPATNAVPEPSAALVLLAGLAGLAGLRRRRS